MSEAAPTSLFRDLEPPGRAEAEPAGVDWQTRWIVAFLVIGVTIRTARYLLRFPLWGDESLLAVNLLDRGFVDLLRPLDNIQIAPLGFLAVEHAATLLLGFSEWSLRLFPFVCSIGSLFVFHRLAKLVFRGEAVVLAVGIFAVSYPGLRYSAEVKPYGVDLFVSTVILTLTAAWWRKQDQTRWLWALAAFVPLGLALSYPAVFVAGGTSIAVAALLYKRSQSREHCGKACWLPWSVYNLLLAATFVGLYAISIHGQERASLALQQECWEQAFPPWKSPRPAPILAVVLALRACLRPASGWRQLRQPRHHAAVHRGRRSALARATLLVFALLRFALRLEPGGGRTAAIPLRRAHEDDDAPDAAGQPVGRIRCGNASAGAWAERHTSPMQRAETIRSLAFGLYLSRLAGACTPASCERGGCRANGLVHSQ